MALGIVKLRLGSKPRFNIVPVFDDRLRSVAVQLVAELHLEPSIPKAGHGEVDLAIVELLKDAHVCTPPDNKEARHALFHIPSGRFPGARVQF